MAKRGSVVYRLPSGKFTPEYISWIAMKQRCLNPKATKYPSYGAKGVKICNSWLLFANFLRDMGPRPKGCTIDRKNGKGNYEPSNCRWATPQEQADNSDVIAKGWKRNNTHCPSGHPYSGDNLRITSSGNRKCRTCEREKRKVRKSLGNSICR